MANDITLNTGSGGAVLATDEIASRHFQLIKVTFGAEDSATLVSTASGLPVDLRANNLGGNLNVAVAAALPAGSNHIGDIDVLAVVPGTGATALGQRRSATPPAAFSGKIDRAFVYDVALTDAEVAALYACGSPLMIRRSELVDYRKLGYFDPEPNWVGAGNTMTVVTAARDYGTPGRLEGLRGTVPLIEEAAVPSGPPVGSLMLMGAGR